MRVQLMVCQHRLHCRGLGRFGHLRLDAELGKKFEFFLSHRAPITFNPQRPLPPSIATIPTCGSTGYSMIDPPVFNIMGGDGEKV